MSFLDSFQYETIMAENFKTSENNWDQNKDYGECLIALMTEAGILRYLQWLV